MNMINSSNTQQQPLYTQKNENTEHTKIYEDGIRRIINTSSITKSISSYRWYHRASSHFQLFMLSSRLIRHKMKTHRAIPDQTEHYVQVILPETPRIILISDIDDLCFAVPMSSIKIHSQYAPPDLQPNTVETQHNQKSNDHILAHI